MNPHSKAKTITKIAHERPGRAHRSTFVTSLAFALIALICSNGLLSSPVIAREASPTRGDVAQKEGDLKELRGQIDSLKKGVASAEGKRTDAADQLKGVEQEISVTQRELRHLGTQRDKLQGTLKELGNQSRELQSRLNSQQTQLEKLVYRQYLKGKPDALRLLLNGNDSSQMTRDLHYLTIIGRARRQLLDETENILQRKRSLAADTRQQAEELAAIEARQKDQHDKLLAQREQRQRVLGTISARISEQRREIGNLQRDETQLSRVIDRLAKVIAANAAQAEKAARAAKAAQAEKSARAAKAAHAEKAQAAKVAQAEKSAQAAKAAPAAKSAKSESPRELARPSIDPATPPLASPKPASVERGNDSTPEAAPAGDFVRQKGVLRLPVRGLVSNRFGGARQEGSTWKGLFIRANAGSPINAIAGGRVVFADWMRGFGNLMIVDHGGSYLSIYGNNEALFKQTGDSVRGGDAIASVGNSGGNPESGLYFELRYRGQPLDPLKWVNLK